MKIPQIERFNAEKIAEKIIVFSRHCVEKKGFFSIVLAGGNTPQQVYDILEQKQPNSNKWEIFFGDERDVPIGDLARNSTMVEKTMPQLIAKAAYFPILSAKDYDLLIAQKMPFDLVLLGIGEDGHTAGIFPDKTYRYLDYVQIINDAPKPPPRRISLRIEALNLSRETWVLATGKSKQSALKKWFDGEKLPISAIEPLEELILFCDQDFL
ncbi:MAG: 6-phosphogluconolactonase [Pseudomonadota bacterium]|jgi:6-phosphogluconolactonase